MNNRQEAIAKKWKSKIKKWIGRIIILGIVSGLLWVLVPLMWMRVNIYWQKMNRGIDSTYKDYYYVNVSGITYAKDKFYILLKKPYLFNAGYGYIFSSKDLINWVEEYHSDYYTFNNIIPNNYNESKSEWVNHDLPRYTNDNCYIMNYVNGLYSKNCSDDWIDYKAFDDETYKLYNKLYLVHISNDLPGYEYTCKFAKQYLTKDNLAYIDACNANPYANNKKALEVLNNIIIGNKLKIILTGSYTTYGSNRYVGVFYKNKQYYFIISTDGVNYRIEPAPSELTSSLAIKLFN